MGTNKEAEPCVLQSIRKYIMMAYNVGLAIVFSYFLIRSVAYSPYRDSEGAESASPPSTEFTSVPTAQATLVQTPQSTPVISPTLVGADQNASSNLSSSSTEIPLTPNILLATMLTMAAAGGAGAVLCNLRGLFKYSYENKGLPCKLEQPYYLRPITGTVTGLSSFLIGYLITSALSDVANLSWATLPGRLPYVGLAVLAGFASQEFTERMKAVAETLFSQTTLRQLSAEDQLRRLKQLKDEGHIDEEEYNLKRRAAVDKL
jgi:hypothetical protein